MGGSYINDGLSWDVPLFLKYFRDWEGKSVLRFYSVAKFRPH